MKLEEIQNEWENDAGIDRSELGEESIKIPKLQDNLQHNSFPIFHFR